MEALSEMTPTDAAVEIVRSEFALEGDTDNQIAMAKYLVETRHEHPENKEALKNVLETTTHRAVYKAAIKGLH